MFLTKNRNSDHDQKLYFYRIIGVSAAVDLLTIITYQYDIPTSVSPSFLRNATNYSTPVFVNRS